MAREPRRIVTMVAPDGVSRVTGEGQVNAIRRTGGGGMIREVWRGPAGGAAAFRPDAPEAWLPDFAPGPGASSCRIVHIPPDAQRWADAAAAGDVARAIGADRPAHWLARHPGMHVTPTLDYAVLLSGRLVMVMEEGEVMLEPGDVVVQQAAVHAWKNEGTEVAVLFVVMLGLEDQAADTREGTDHG